MKYETVIFDLYGTIVDFLPLEEYDRKDSQIAQLLGVPLETYKQAWKETRDYRDEGRFGSLELDIDNLCHILGLRVPHKTIARAADITMNLYARGLRPRAGALETLSVLRAAGIKTGLLSDCALDTPRLWPDTPFPSLFDAVVFSCEIGIRKPHPRTYQMVCQQLGVTPDKCVYVGDGGSQELSGAHSIGMYPVRIAHTGKSATDPVWPGMEQWDSEAVERLPDILHVVGVSGSSS